MKKNALIIIFLIMKIYASAYNFRWDIGSVSFGGQMSDEIIPVIDIRLLDFNLEFDKGFYTYITPFKYSCIINKTEEENNHIEYFLNFGFGYDLFKFKNQVQLMPYIETNYLALEGLSNYRIESGICLKVFSNNAFSENAELYNMKGEILNLRSGVIVQNQKPAFYFSVGTELLNLLMFFWGTKQ